VQFLPRDAMLSVVYATPVPSVCHTRALCQNGWTYNQNSFTIW